MGGGSSLCPCSSKLEFQETSEVHLCETLDPELLPWSWVTAADGPTQNRETPAHAGEICCCYFTLSVCFLICCHSPSSSLQPTKYFKSSINLCLCPSCRVQTPQAEGGAHVSADLSSCLSVTHALAASSSSKTLQTCETCISINIWFHWAPSWINIHIYCCGQQVLASVSLERMKWFRMRICAVCLYWSDCSEFIWKMF